MRPGASHESRDFFLSLPADVLKAVKGVSSEADDAYKERRSWIESIEEVVDDEEAVKLEHHAFFKPPKPKLAITEAPTNKPPGPGSSTSSESQ